MTALFSKVLKWALIFLLVAPIILVLVLSATLGASEGAIILFIYLGIYYALVIPLAALYFLTMYFGFKRGAIVVCVTVLLAFGWYRYTTEFDYEPIGCASVHVVMGKSAGDAVIGTIAGAPCVGRTSDLIQVMDDEILKAR